MLERPLVPGNYTIWFEPPDESGDEVLRIVSERRSLKLKGHSFREFHRRVVPLLDGRNTIEEIRARTADLFRPEDLDAALALLQGQGVLVEGGDADLADEAAERMTPQINLFHTAPEGAPALQARLSSATVAMVGLGGAGAAAALGLAAAGVGTLICVDCEPVAATDVYLSGCYGLADVGRGRAESLAGRIAAAAPEATVRIAAGPLSGEADLRRAIAGADWVISCLDAAQLNLALKLNKVCFEDRLSWIACGPAGEEIVVGPTMVPGRGACYMCYRMRAVACAGNPEEAFAYERHLDRSRTDESGRRANLNFGIGLAANLVGIETVKALSGYAEPSLVGRILIADLAELRFEKHVVLRKPWCPICHGGTDAAGGA